MGVAVARADDTALSVEQFKKQYRAAAGALNASYEHVTISTTEDRWGSDGKHLWKTSVLYERDGSSVRKESNYLSSDAKNTPAGFKMGLGGNASKFFEIAKTPSQDQYSFRQFGPKAEKRYFNDVAFQCVPLFATRFSDAVDIPAAVEGSNFNSLKRISLDGRDVWDLTRDSGLVTRARTVVDLYFLPNSLAFAGATWHMLQKDESVKDPHQAIELRVEYGEGNPLPLRSIHKWDAFVGDASPLKHEVFQINVNSIKFGDVPPERFTVASFGLTEPGTLPTKPASHLLLWATDILVAIVIVGVLVYLLRSRQKRPEPQAQT